MTTTTTTESGRMSELVRYFLRLGCLGFGGPVALVGQMERELVWGAWAGGWCFMLPNFVIVAALVVFERCGP